MNFDTGVLQVPIEDIIPNRFQPRLVFDDAALQDLAASIKEHGIIQPLILRKVNDKYEIIAGERRYKAAMLAGLTAVPGIVAKIDNEKSAQVAVVENIQRKDLNAIEEAKSYKLLLEQGLMNQDTLAKKMGLSQGAISNKLRLLNLTKEVQNAVSFGKISERHARALLVVKDPNEQVEWLNRIIEERLNVRQLDNLLKAEYGEFTAPVGDVDIIKTIATDIDIPKEDSSSFDLGLTSFDMGSIKSSSNNLESEAANMSVEEPESLFFDSFTPAMDEIETLDFEPPKQKEISDVRKTLNGVISSLSSDGWYASMKENVNGNYREFIITVKEDD